MPKINSYILYWTISILVLVCALVACNDMLEERGADMEQQSKAKQRDHLRTSHGDKQLQELNVRKFGLELKLIGFWNEEELMHSGGSIRQKTDHISINGTFIDWDWYQFRLLNLSIAPLSDQYSTPEDVISEIKSEARKKGSSSWTDGISISEFTSDSGIEITQLSYSSREKYKKNLGGDKFRYETDSWHHIHFFAQNRDKQWIHYQTPRGLLSLHEIPHIKKWFEESLTYVENDGTSITTLAITINDYLISE